MTTRLKIASLIFVILALFVVPIQAQDNNDVPDVFAQIPASAQECDVFVNASRYEPGEMPANYIDVTNDVDDFDEDELLNYMEARLGNPQPIYANVPNIHFSVNDDHIHVSPTWYEFGTNDVFLSIVGRLKSESRFEGVRFWFSINGEYQSVSLGVGVNRNADGEWSFYISRLSNIRDVVYDMQWQGTDEIMKFVYDLPPEPNRYIEAEPYLAEAVNISGDFIAVFADILDGQSYDLHHGDGGRYSYGWLNAEGWNRGWSYSNSVRTATYNISNGVMSLQMAERSDVEADANAPVCEVSMRVNLQEVDYDLEGDFLNHAERHAVLSGVNVQITPDSGEDAIVFNEREQ